MAEACLIALNEEEVRVRAVFILWFDYIDQFGFDLFRESLRVQEHVVALGVTAGWERGHGGDASVE